MRVGSYCGISRSQTSYLVRRKGAYSLAPAQVTSSVYLRVRGSRPDVVVRLNSYDDIGSNVPCSGRLRPVHSSILKDNAETFAPMIMQIVNASLQSGTVPADMKHALVTPLHKPHDVDQSRAGVLCT